MKATGRETTILVSLIIQSCALKLTHIQNTPIAPAPAHLMSRIRSSSPSLNDLAELMRDGQKNVNNTVMLINYVKVFQQSDIAPIERQAATNENQTGAAGPVAISSGCQMSTVSALGLAFAIFALTLSFVLRSVSLF